jgi:hypothetical protein
MAAADKLWFELGVRDEISGVLEKLMRNSEKLANALSDDAAELKNVYQNIVDVSNVYDKIYIAQKRISELKGTNLTRDEKKGLKNMSNELENVRKQFTEMFKDPDRLLNKGEVKFDKLRLNIELMLKDTLRYVDNIEAKEAAEAKNAANESRRIDDLKAKYYELQRYRKQLSDAIVGAAPGTDTSGSVSIINSISARMSAVKRAERNGSGMPASASGADYEEFLRRVKAELNGLTSATSDYNSRLEANKQLQSALNKLSADATSQQKIAGIRKQTVEYAALGRKIQEIQALIHNVSYENGLLMSGRITTPTWTKEKVTEELNAIQRRYNESLAAGKQREIEDAAAKNQRANAAKKAADAVGMLAHVNEGLISSYNRIAEAGSQANRITVQLQNQIGAYAGLYGLERVLKSIVTIGGQFEVQHVALQNILGDVQEANILFGQLKELAIESPKTFMELTSYAKQLSAYQIPANELYETTKRLADMSSGLGVDMNRLILAYGQVRSAAVLRGQELRQFTEAGIPMVQALADKFTQLNGKLTTTADVFKLISARAVPFEMVKEVLWDMTSQGGQFFNMQEELANTLYGKWQKLQDSWQIMLGSIAEGTNASGYMFKKVLDFAVLLTQNLDKMVLALSALGAAKGLKYMAEGLSNTLMKRSGEMAIRNMQLAKIQEANRLERERVMYGRQLNAIEKELVRTKTVLNSREQALLVQSGAISSEKARQLIQDGKISRMAAYRLALEQGITKEKIRQMAVSNNWSALGGAGAAATPMSKMGKLLGVGAKGAFGFFGGWVGIAITALGAAASIWSYIKESDERLNDLVNSISGSAEQNANQLATTLKSVGESTDEPFKKVEALEEALIGMGNAGKQVVQDSRGFDTISERLENLTKNAQAYQEALNAMGTPAGKASIKEALDNSDLNDEMGEYEDLQNAEYKAKAALERYSARYQQMIDAMKTKHKELVEQLNSSNLYDNLRILMTGPYENEAVGYFAGGTPWGSAITDYAKAVEESEAHLNNIKNNIIPDAMTDLKVLARQAGVDISKKYEELTEEEKTKLRTIATNFANGLEKGSQDAKNSIASWVAQGFYTQLYITPVINTNELTGLPYELDKWQKGKGYGLWSKNDLKDANTDFISFSKKQSQRKVDLEKKIKNYDTQLKGTALDPDLVPTIRGQRQALQTELDQLNDSLKAGQWIFDKSLTKGQRKGGEKKDAALEALKNRVDLYKKFYSELENARKLYGSGATDYLKANGFAEVFGWNLGDVTNYRQSLDELTKGFVVNTEARRKFASSVDADKVSQQRKADAEAISKINSELKTQLSMLSEQYDTYKKIYQLTGNQQGAMTIAFGGGVQSATYKDELMRQMREALKANPQGSYTAEQVFAMSKTDFATKIGDNSKIFSELYEAYAANERKIKQETLQLMEETVNKNRTLAQQIEDENRRYERQLELIKQINDPTLRQQAEAGATQEHNEKTAHLQFEQFKANSNWVKIFDDLDRVTTETLRDLMTATEQFGHTAGLSVEDVKALQDAISKMRNELANRNPFYAMSDALSRMKILSNAEKTHADGDIAGTQLGKVLGVDPNTKVTKKDIKNGKKAAGSDFVKGVEGLRGKFDTLASALDPVINLFDQLGMKGVGQAVGAVQGALGGAATGAAGAAAIFGQAAGPWGAAIGAGVSLISSGIEAIFGGHDEALEEEIQASKRRQKEMENLTKNLETVLEHTLGGIYTAKADKETSDKMAEYRQKYEERERARRELNNGNITIQNLIGATSNDYIQERTYKAIKEAEQSQSYYDAQKASLMVQQDELRSQIESEKDKKETDWDKIQDMEQQIKELELEIRYFAEEMAKDLYGIDYKSWASGLADALVDAWATGENAVDAYKKKVSEMIKEVGTKIIAQKYLEPLLEKNMEEFMKYFEANDGRMDERGLEILAKMYSDADEAARITTVFLDGLEQIANRHGDSIRDDADSSASSSIKNITESTADLLASYLNAIRADVSVNRATLLQMLAIVQGQSEMPIIARAQLAQLEQIARNTNRNANFAEDIYNLLHSLAPDGQGIKIK